MQILHGEIAPWHAHGRLPYSLLEKQNEQSLCYNKIVVRAIAAISVVGYVTLSKAIDE